MRAGKHHGLQQPSLWTALLATIIFCAALGPVSRDCGGSAGAAGGAPTAALRPIHTTDPGGIGGVGG